jgi:hypothetical protein
MTGERAAGGERGVARRLLEELGVYRPALAALLHERGDTVLKAYAESLFASTLGVTDTLAGVVAGKVRALLDDAAAERVRAQLRTCPTVLTADHHSILGEPTLLQGDVLAALGAGVTGRSCALVLAFGNVPLNNASYPRGVVLGRERFPLFADSRKHAMVYACESFGPERLARLPAPLRGILADCPGLLAQTRLADQVTLANHGLWRRLLPDLPELIYLQAEEVAAALLEHSFDRRDEIFHAICDPAAHRRALALFEGIRGAWDTAAGTGSHWFWGCSPDGARRRLVSGAGALEGDGVRVELRPAAVVHALRQRRLVPGLLLTFLCLLRHGAHCLGGFHQVDYLPRIRARYARYCRDQRLDDVATRLELLPGDGLCSSCLFVFDRRGTPAGLESLLVDNAATVATMRDNFGTMSLRSAALLGAQHRYGRIAAPDRADARIRDAAFGDVAAELGVRTCWT